MILLASDDILDYQATQERGGQLHIYLDVRPGADWAHVAQSTRRSVETTLAAYACHADAIEITHGLPPQAAGAKRRRVARVTRRQGDRVTPRGTR